MQIVDYIVLGSIIGFFSAIFGIGGSIISTPVLKIVFGLPDLIALASPLPVIIPTAMAGSYNYWKKGLIRRDIILPTILGAMPATILGALGTKIVASKWLMVLTGIMVILIGVGLIINSQNKKLSVKITDKFVITKLAVMIGIISGIFSGLLAIGGGIIMVPAFIILLGLSMQEAASTSLICIVFMAIPGTIVHCLLGNISWHVVLSLGVGVIPASYLGSKVALGVKSKYLQAIFSIFLIIFGIYFVLSEL